MLNNLLVSMSYLEDWVGSGSPNIYVVESLLSGLRIFS